MGTDTKNADAGEKEPKRTRAASEAAPSDEASWASDAASSSTAEAERARSAALRLLTHRARSISEMRARLARHDFSEELIEKEIQRLVQAGLLDDGSFAREKASSLVRRGLGPKGLRSKLAASGVPEDAAEAALDEAMQEVGGEEALAREVVSRRYGDLSGSDQKTRAKAARYLLRRGFSTRVAGAACGIFADEEV